MTHLVARVISVVTYQAAGTGYSSSGLDLILKRGKQEEALEELISQTMQQHQVGVLNKSE